MVRSEQARSHGPSQESSEAQPVSPVDYSGFQIRTKFMATLTAEIKLPAHLIPEVLKLLAEFSLTAYLANTDRPSQDNPAVTAPVLSILVEV
jgi:hypothetical protein